MLRLFLDTNVIVSGLLFHGPEAELLLEAERGSYTAVLSVEVIAEARRVLRDKFRLPEREVDEAVQALTHELAPAPPREAVAAALRLLRDPADAPILASALHAAVSALVTGDRDLLDVAEPAAIAVMRAPEALALLADTGS